jgi:predicted tellurium resistance membrane protein TerC
LPQRDARCTASTSSRNARKRRFEKTEVALRLCLICPNRQPAEDGGYRALPERTRQSTEIRIAMDYLLALAADPAVWAALVTLVVMEVVLGIDNLIFISILSNKLPPAQRARTQRIGILCALVLRLALLGTVAWIARLTAPAFELFGHAFSWRDMILLGGGLFLVWKATREIHHHVAHDASAPGSAAGAAGTLTVGAAIGQILVLDMVFSVDSIITAVGMTEHVPIMFIAVIAAVTAMLFAARPLAAFIDRNPTIVMLALSFLVVIGMALIAEGFGSHVPKGYIYTAMAFSAFVEAMNMLARRAKLRRGAQAAAGRGDTRDGHSRSASSISERTTSYETPR